jgi:hypothetical protein
MATYTAIANENTKHFEFVTLTSEPTTVTTRQTSKTVRKQAMNDYLRKQNLQATTGQIEAVESSQLKEPSLYKGKFKLDTWSHKTKTKAILARRAKIPESRGEFDDGQRPQSISSNALTSHDWHEIGGNDLPRPSSLNTSLDPFNTLSIDLGPLSNQILLYCASHFLLFTISRAD